MSTLSSNVPALITALALSGVAAVVAHRKGRSGVLYFFLSLLFSPLLMIFIALWVKPNPAKAGVDPRMEASPELTAGRGLYIFLMCCLSALLVEVFFFQLAKAFYGAHEKEALQVVTVPASLLATLVAGMVAYKLVDRLGPAVWSQVGWTRTSLTHMLAAAALGASLPFFGAVLAHAFPPARHDTWGPLTTTIRSGGWNLYLGAILAVLVAPPVEEFIFRGVLLSSFARSWGLPWAVLVVISVFAAGHVPEVRSHWPALLTVALLGGATVWARLKTRSLAPAVLLHASFNFVILLGLWVSAAPVSASEPPQIQVTAGNVTDTRRTGGQAGEMKIQVKLTVTGLTNDTKGFRVVVAKALDDTGLDLISRQSIAPEFKMTKDFELKLINPARKAARIKELSGDVELFIPKNDPAASVMVNSFPKDMGTPIQSGALKAAGVEIVARAGAEYEALQQKKETAKSKKGAGPNDIALSVKGASEAVFGCEFHDQSDATIHPSGRMVMNRYRDKQEFERTLIYYFNARLPETTKLVIFVVTPRAVVKVPFALTDIRLP